MRFFFLNLIFVPCFIYSQNPSCALYDFNEFRKSVDVEWQDLIDYNEFLLQDIIEQSASSAMLSQTITIPVVVHIIHTGEAEGTAPNISDGQVIDAINDLNSKFSNLNGLGVDIEVEFCLAQRDPDGNSTDGIIRVNGSHPVTGVPSYGTLGITTSNELEVKDLSRWDNSDYYNIWVVTEIDGNGGGSGRQGFAHYPGIEEEYDGAVVLHNAFGINGSVKTGFDQNVTIAHEIAHSFYLYHTFEGDCLEDESVCYANNSFVCPANDNPQEDGDKCEDTYPHIRSMFDCNTLGTNLCNPSDQSTANYIHNYMDYSSSSCRDRFTDDQSERMQATLLGFRNALTYSIGCTPPCPGLEANFDAPTNEAEVGTSLTFINTSTNSTMWSWQIDGEEIGTNQNLTYDFPEGGVFDLCLFASSSSTCEDRHCITFKAFPACSPPELECLLVPNGDFEQIQKSIAVLDFTAICGWDAKVQTPFYCAKPNNSCVAVMFESRVEERIVSEEPINLVTGNYYTLSFDYLTGLRAPDEFIIALTSTNDEEDLPIGATILANLTNLALDVPFQINHECYPDGKVFNDFRTTFQYDGNGSYLNITGDADKRAIVYIDNISISECNENCTPNPDFSAIIDSCEVSFTGTNTGDPGVFSWDFGDGTIAQGENPNHTYLFDGTFNVCLTINCSETRAGTYCEEITIQSSCDQCSVNEVPVTVQQCEDDSTYVAEISFYVPAGYGPCNGLNLNFHSDDVDIYVTSSTIVNINGSTDQIIASVDITNTSGSVFENNGTIAYLTLCTPEGDPVCYSVTLNPSTCNTCDDTTPTSQAICDYILSEPDNFVYTGQLTFITPVAFNQLCGSFADNVGFSIDNISNNQGNWTIDYAISSNGGIPYNTNTLFVVCDASVPPQQMCFEVPILIGEPCIFDPEECEQYWTDKEIYCSEEEGGTITFPTGNMSIPVPSGFELCPNGLDIVVETSGGSASVNSASIINGTLNFNANIFVPNTFDLSEPLLVKFLFCNEENTEVICQGIYFDLKCSGGIGGQGRIANPINFNDYFSIYPNPSNGELQIFISRNEEIIEAKIRILDQLGKVIFLKNIDPIQQNVKIDVSGLLSGLYFVVLTSQDEFISSKKVVIIN